MFTNDSFTLCVIYVKIASSVILKNKISSLGGIHLKIDFFQEEYIVNVFSLSLCF